MNMLLLGSGGVLAGVIAKPPASGNALTYQGQVLTYQGQTLTRTAP